MDTGEPNIFMLRSVSRCCDGHAAGATLKDSAFLALVCVFSMLLCAPAIANDSAHPTLAVGSPAPDFCLPGVDGQTHCLKDYAASKVLVIAFICNHCPTSQLYETRIKQIAEDYKDKGVAVVAIEPNNPDAVLLNEMGYTDVGDSLEDMKTRAEYRHFNFPYLYDGETQKISTAYGPTATPHIFIFDSDRKLRYEGRVDNNMREPLVTGVTHGTPSMRSWRASRLRSRRLPPWAARPSGFTKKQAAARRWKKSPRSRSPSSR